MEQTKNRAKVQALRLLTVRDRSVQELRDRLEQRCAQEDTEEALEYVARMGYIDDLRVAENHVRYRNRQRPTGNYLLRIELRNKGIQDDYIDKVLNPPDLEYMLALELGQQRLPGLERLEKNVAVRRLHGLLERRGFPGSLARRVVSELLDRDPENEYN